MGLVVKKGSKMRDRTVSGIPEPLLVGVLNPWLPLVEIEGSGIRRRDLSLLPSALSIAAFLGKGKKSGKPRFKNAASFRTIKIEGQAVTIERVEKDWLFLSLPKMDGWFRGSRELLAGGTHVVPREEVLEILRNARSLHCRKRSV